MIKILKNIAKASVVVSALVTTPAMALEVYLFRGLAGVPFSVGLDDLEDKLKSSGIKAETYPHGVWQDIYSKIIKSGTKEVAFVGHSMGALSALSLTDKLKNSGVRVAYLGLIDIPGSKRTAPKNAAWAEAYVSAQPGFSLLKRNPRYKNLIVNTRVPRTVHITIDDSERVHDAIISAVWLADASFGQAPRRISAYVAQSSSKSKFDTRRFDMMTTGAVK